MPEHEKFAVPQKNNTVSESNQSKQMPQIKDSHPAAIIQRAKINPQSLTYAHVMQLQKTIGNLAVCQLFRQAGLMNENSKQILSEPFQKKENNTSLPYSLRSGMEEQSGLSPGDVKLRYNSDKPAELGALTHTWGKPIQLRQERHLPYKDRQVVMQARDRFYPTLQQKSSGINDERVQRTVGNRAMKKSPQEQGQPPAKVIPPGGAEVIQGYNLHQVGYDDPMVDEVRDERGNNDDFTGVNYATFWVNDQPTTESSDQYHSEKECWLTVGNDNNELQDIKVTTWPTGDFGGTHTANEVRQNNHISIDPVYTERQPCGGCAPLLNEILPTDADVYYTFVYPSKETRKFNHWEMDPDQFAMNALLSMHSGLQYEEQTGESQKIGRKLGNKELKKELRHL